jgi:hypothetical protein
MYSLMSVSHWNVFCIVLDYTNKNHVILYVKEAFAHISNFFQQKNQNILEYQF